MDKDKLKSLFKNRDRVISVLSDDGFFRVSLINNTLAAQTAQEKHKLSGIPAVILAKQLAAASMLAIFLKGEERIILETTGNAMISMVHTEAIQLGEVRGFVSLNSDFENFQMQSSQNYFGEGLFKVTKILYSKQEPITGVVELQNGDISSELTNYFFQSEQIPTAVILEANADERGNITGSAGLVIQVLPGATAKAFDSINEYLSKADSLIHLFGEYPDPEIVLKHILPFEFKLMKRDIVDFFCRCSKDSFKEKLITFDLKELKSMKAENHNELICQFCNSHYYLTESDFDELIAQVQAKQN